MYFSESLLKHAFFLDKLWPLFLSNRIILILSANYKCSQLLLAGRTFAFRSFCTNLAFDFILPPQLPTPPPCCYCHLSASRPDTQQDRLELKLFPLPIPRKHLPKPMQLALEKRGFGLRGFTGAWSFFTEYTAALPIPAFLTHLWIQPTANQNQYFQPRVGINQWWRN